MKQQGDFLRREAIARSNIVKQLKNPRSEFNILLCKQYNNKRKKSSQANLASRDFMMRAAEFKIEIRFQWDPTIKHNNSGLLIPHADGGHNVIFDAHDQVRASIDISLNRTGWLESLVIEEEVIIHSLNNPGHLVFGTRILRLRHDDAYNFFTVVDSEIRNQITFDIKSLKFMGDTKNAIQQWNNRWKQFNNDDRNIYLDYLHDDTKHSNLIKHLNSSQIDADVKKKIVAVFEVPWFNREDLTRLGVIVKEMEKLGEQQNETTI